MYGRRNLFLFTYVFFTIFNGVVTASQNVWTLIILRFMAGVFGSSPLTNAGGTVADVFDAKQRGLGMAIFAAAPFLGPAVGPIVSLMRDALNTTNPQVGGFVGETVGWRWVAAMIALFSGTLTVVGFLLIPETYASVLLKRRAAALTKATGKEYRIKSEAKEKQELGPLFKTALSRPWKLLFREPIVFLLSLYLAIVYGTLYVSSRRFASITYASMTYDRCSLARSPSSSNKNAAGRPVSLAWPFWGF